LTRSPWLKWEALRPYLVILRELDRTSKICYTKREIILIK